MWLLAPFKLSPETVARFKAEVIGMAFSYSTFTVEINEVPIFVFQATRHSEADEICREWTEKHLDEWLAKEAAVYDPHPSIKVRLAHPDERASYENATDTSASTGDIKLVYLVNFAP
jgi:hypothetical protein